MNPGMRDTGSAIEMLVPWDEAADNAIWLRQQLRELGYKVDKQHESEGCTVFTVCPDELHVVRACPECDNAGQLYERDDGTIRCYDCDAVFEQPELRRNRRGENLNVEDRRRGGNAFTLEPERLVEIAKLPRVEAGD